MKIYSVIFQKVAGGGKAKKYPTNICNILSSCKSIQSQNSFLAEPITAIPPDSSSDLLIYVRNTSSMYNICAHAVHM